MRFRLTVGTRRVLPKSLEYLVEGIMIADGLIEQRMRALESTVANLQVRVSKIAPAADWIDRITGSISDDEAFQEALEFGRAYRHADRPEDETGTEP